MLMIMVMMDMKFLGPSNHNTITTELFRARKEKNMTMMTMKTLCCLFQRLVVLIYCDCLSLDTYTFKGGGVSVSTEKKLNFFRKLTI